MKIRSLVKQLQEERAKYHEKAHKLTPPQVADEVKKFKDLNAKIVEAITDGAKDCPDCLAAMKQLEKEWPERLKQEEEIAARKSKELGRPVEPANIGKPPKWDAKPHGIFHDGTAKPFEVGCLRCRDHRVRESLPEDAVDRWNDDDYDPPREPGTVVATKRDATGKVVEQKTLKVQTR